MATQQMGREGVAQPAALQRAAQGGNGAIGRAKTMQWRHGVNQKPCINGTKREEDREKFLGSYGRPPLTAEGVAVNDGKEAANMDKGTSSDEIEPSNTEFKLKHVKKQPTHLKDYD